MRSSPVVSPRQADISGERYSAWPSRALTRQRAGGRQLCTRTSPLPDGGSHSTRPAYRAFCQRTDAPVVTLLPVAACVLSVCRKDGAGTGRTLCCGW